VSLDDGVTWKQTNLSEAADLSSFNLETDHIPGNKDPLPNDHTILLGGGNNSALHAPGYELPFTSHCTECHGVGLQGTAQAPSCYSCHGNKWDEPAPLDIGPIVYEALADRNRLKISGENALPRVTVTIINAINGDVVGTARANPQGRFNANIRVGANMPCVVAAQYTNETNRLIEGPAITVVDRRTGEPVENCVGSPINLVEYPGGAFNVFHATAGNKTLIAWPSRFCSQGQPAYSMVTEDGLADPDQQARLTNITNFIRGGSETLGISGLEGFTSPIDETVDDLYLFDAFGVAGKQGSIDFADEGYPQAGVVPFGCVWTARGILLPGDDPRTEDVEESSHMVWTKAERLTSGRRDPNRIEVKAVKGAGFAITWQEDPEGLRPGQGEGPGEGWSGAVAHPQTDVWYSFINWEYFDLVEQLDESGEVLADPINVIDHDLAVSGRPQVFVPMAIPMRLTNNAKCNAPDETTGVITDDPYCDYALAAPFGLKNQCADTITVLTGPDADRPTLMCVADSDGDGVADLPNRANTSATRPRLGLQGYTADAATGDRSAWVMMAVEESKGLGKYFFRPDADGDGYAELCTEEESETDPTCTEEIGKNAWWHSFDMGTPDTSAGIREDGTLEPNSLVANLVYQGDLLNQPEVYWETGEWYGKMNTAVMGENGTSLYGVYDFEIVSTEIARRTSLLVQSIDKAVASVNGLVAIPSWKQGPMRQGGPADTFLRRMVLPEDYVPEEPAECPIDDNVDNPEKPVVESATLRVISTGGWRLEVTVSGYDGIPWDTTTRTGTRLQLRNAVTTALYGSPRIVDETGTSVTYNINADTWNAIPCAIQLADWDVPTPAFGPWTVVDTSAVPDLVCTGPIPPECPIDENGGVLAAAAALPGIEVNPYGFENMVCETFLIEPGANPYYPKGVCADTPTNLSSVTPDTCVDDGDGEDVCPTVTCDTSEEGSTFCIGDTNPILQGVVQGEGNTTRVLTWHQCPSGGAPQEGGDITPVTCDATVPESNLQDQSWYNPLDISKGHRGFLDGDFVMFLYAWSPNWRLNAKGSDRYDLYIRRSFDGGNSWTTTPNTFDAADGNNYSGSGTVTCESYRGTETGTGEPNEPKVCYDFAPGVAEHARNVTQHKSMNITTLDPRYAMTGSVYGLSITDTCLDGLPETDATGADSTWSCDDTSLVQDTDARNASRYFVVFETGDNNTVADGEAEPLDLFYMRAESFGDNYVVWTETDTDGLTADLAACWPNTAYETDVSDVVVGSGFCNEFDNMNTGGDTGSSEADLEANPDGSKLYAVWTQWVYETKGDYESDVIEADAMARRVWWLDDWVSDTNAYTLPGSQNTAE
jgi:hypothetical protein